jgi:hypothetical protein
MEFPPLNDERFIVDWYSAAGEDPKPAWLPIPDPTPDPSRPLRLGNLNSHHSTKEGGPQPLYDDQYLASYS